jgi:hypothetical protein
VIKSEIFFRCVREFEENSSEGSRGLEVRVMELERLLDRVCIRRLDSFLTSESLLIGATSACRYGRLPITHCCPFYEDLPLYDNCRANFLCGSVYEDHLLVYYLSRSCHMSSL